MLLHCDLDRLYKHFRCCQTHDQCYDKLRKDHNCNKWLMYVNAYKWKKEKNRKIKCSKYKSIVGLYRHVLSLRMYYKVLLLFVAMG